MNQLIVVVVLLCAGAMIDFTQLGSLDQDGRFTSNHYGWLICKTCINLIAIAILSDYVLSHIS